MLIVCCMCAANTITWLFTKFMATAVIQASVIKLEGILLLIFEDQGQRWKERGGGQTDTSVLNSRTFPVDITWSLVFNQSERSWMMEREMIKVMVWLTMQYLPFTPGVRLNAFILSLSKVQWWDAAVMNHITFKEQRRLPATFFLFLRKRIWATRRENVLQEGDFYVMSFKLKFHQNSKSKCCE